MNDAPLPDSQLLVGVHPVAAALALETTRVREVWLQKERRTGTPGGATERGGIADLARTRGVRVTWAARPLLDRLAPGRVHQGVVARCHAVGLRSEAEFMRDLPRWKDPLLLVLDGITDPRNLGAVLRTALGANVAAVLMPKRRAAPITDVVMKAASGAAERLYIVSVTNLARRLRWLKDQGVWLVGAAADGPTPWFDAPMGGALAVVVGGEGGGLRRLTVECCDHLVQVPMAGGLESLNVSVATGILLFEAVRQRAAGGC